jgi:hypothetical protein
VLVVGVLRLHLHLLGLLLVMCQVLGWAPHTALHPGVQGSHQQLQGQLVWGQDLGCLAAVVAAAAGVLLGAVVVAHLLLLLLLIVLVVAGVLLLICGEGGVVTPAGVQKAQSSQVN